MKNKLIARIEALEERLTILEVGLDQISEQLGSQQPKKENWQSQDEEADHEDGPQLPAVQRTNEPIESDQESITKRAAHFLTSSGREERKQAEDYLKARVDPVKRRQMLVLLLDLVHKTQPGAIKGNLAEIYKYSDDEIEHILMLDIDVGALAYLKSKASK